MIFKAGGFEVSGDVVGRSVFLHSLTGKGSPDDLSKFMHCVLSSIDVPILVTANDKREKVYRRLGFIETGGLIEGFKVLVRFPVKETMN